MGAGKRKGEVEGIPILAHTLRAFQSSPLISEIVVVAAATNLESVNHLVQDFAFSKVTGVGLGGLRRQDSVWNGISRLSGCDWVVIHDGARPFVDAEMIARGLEEAMVAGAAVAAVPTKDTIKIADQTQVVQQTLPREYLWSAQTPQVFRYDIIADAYSNVAQDVTDDAQLVELRGWPVKVFMGSYENIKITTPEDLDLAHLILKRRRNKGG